MPRDLIDQVIIITGASAGIGQATALACAAAGMDLVLTARREDRLQALARRVQDVGRRAVIAPGAVTAPGMPARLLDAAMQQFGRVDAVFANAGYGFRRPIHAVADREMRDIWEVNFFAGVDLLRHAARRLIEQRRAGHLLMCSSCVAKFTMPCFGAYCATKAAQNLVCRSMRLELEPYDIEVSSVHPVSTRTEFSDVSARHGLSDAAISMGSVPILDHHTPRGFTQSSDTVARAVVRCLRRPTPEVWTSPTTRLGAALMTAWPTLADLVFRRLRSRMCGPRDGVDVPTAEGRGPGG